jgi:hypothetical protein
MRTVLSSAVSLGFMVVPAVTATAQVKPVDQQITEAVSALPETVRAGAKVLGYRGDGGLRTIREGQTFVCLADDPANPNFHVACYHESLEPFMARGRELRRDGKTVPESQQIRAEEIRGGTLQMPVHAALYSLSGPVSQATGKPDSVAALFVIYMPNATEEGTGVAAQPSRERPWLMFPGQPISHVMVSGGWRKP